LTVIAWLAAGAIDPRKQYVSLSPGCHVSVNLWGNVDARLEVFNDANYGPYSGSITGVAGSPLNPTESAFGDSAGVYYRHFRYPNGAVLWTLSLSLVYPLVASMPLLLVWYLRRTNRQRRGFSIDPPPAG